MTPHGIVTRATLADAAWLAQNLREADRRELEDLTGGTALDSLRRSVLLGKPALTLRTNEGEIVAILSVVPWGSNLGFIGLSGTPAIEENRMAFLRGSRDVLAELDKRFDTLGNVCDARNEVHHKWLKWLGFAFIARHETYGAGGIPVFEFARIRPNV